MTYRSGVLTGIVLTVAIFATVAGAWRVVNRPAAATAPAPPPAATVTKTAKEDQLNVVTLSPAAEKQLAVRTARAAGASWSQIGAALGTSKQSAWEAHTRWIDDQADQHRRTGYEGLDDDQIAAARHLAGNPD